MRDTFRRIGLTTNPEKVGARALIRRYAQELQARGYTIHTDQTTARIVKPAADPAETVAALAAECDLLVVFGGDGTMLGACRALAGVKTPILGVNVGGLGFLTALAGKELRRGLSYLETEQYSVEERPLIECRGQSGQSLIAQLALNDFVVSRGATSRLIELEVRVSGEPLTDYRCDGLIISSPTGSTAYSLAAGGAIVTPDAPVLTITPICPHTLSNRSVIVSSDATVEVTVMSQKLEVFLTADGQVQMPLETGNCIKVRKSNKAIRLLRFPGSNFFTTLRQKLNWRGSHV